MRVKEMGGSLLAKGIKAGLVVSRYNDFFTRQLLAGALDCLVRHGAAEEDQAAAWVPGANEIPAAARKMAASGRYDAVVALGAVIQGATQHADLINTQVSRALSNIALETGVPVINGVVCTQNIEQAIERSGTKAGNKGWVAAQAAIEMVNLYRELDA